MIYFKLFLTFLEIGAVSFGGGYGMISLIREAVLSNHWLTESELINFIAVSESTPGPLGVNMATYAGYHAYGVLGGVVATLALILPSLIIIILVAKILEKFKENRLVKDTFATLRPCVTAMIAAACWQVMEKALFTVDAFLVTMNPADLINYKAMCLFILCYWLMRRYKKHPILYIAGAAVCGIVFQMA